MQDPGPVEGGIKGHAAVQVYVVLVIGVWRRCPLPDLCTHRRQGAQVRAGPGGVGAFHRAQPLGQHLGRKLRGGHVGQEPGGGLQHLQRLIHVRRNHRGAHDAGLTSRAGMRKG